MFEFDYIDTKEKLDDFIDELKGVKRLAIDTESNQLQGYNVRICLVQIATPHHIGLIDVEVLPQDSMERLRTFLESPHIEKVLHASDNDLIGFQRDFNIRLGHLFDTFLATRFLNLPNKGLGKLLLEYFNLKTSKKFQKLDWSMRPIPEEALEYAVYDVLHLSELWDILAEQLEKENLLDAVIEESQFLLTRVPQAKTFDEQGFLKLRGANDLWGSSLKVLKELYIWRHHICTELDRAAFLVLNDRDLLNIAHQKPRNVRELRDITHYKNRYIKKYSHDILEVIQLGLSSKKNPLTSANSSHASKKHSSINKEFLKKLKLWRHHIAEKELFEDGLVMSNAVLEELTRKRPTSLDELLQIPAMLSWRVERYGNKLLKVLHH